MVCQQERAYRQTFLLRSVEQETIDLERRSAARPVKAARFPLVKTLDTFGFRALGFAACQRGRNVRFFTTTGLATHPLERREHRAQRMSSPVRKPLERLHRAGSSGYIGTTGRAFSQT